MQPLQVWLPALSGSLGFPEIARDVQRAFNAWEDESIVFFLPGLAKPERWYESGLRVLAVPAEHADRVDVFHIGENGYVSGPESGTRFPDARVDGLLDAWLNVFQLGAIRQFPAEDDFVLWLPVVKDGNIAEPTGNDDEETINYGPQRIARRSGSALLVKHVDEEADTINLSWPPNGRPGMVSPEAEAPAYYGSLTRMPFQGLASTGEPTQPALVSMYAVTRWPEPLSPLLPLGTGADDLMAQAEMCAAAKMSATDMERAMQLATKLCGAYVTEGTATLRESWLYPRWMKASDEGSEAVLIEAELHFGIPTDGLTIKGLWDVPEWQALLLQRVPIRRAWGAAGLFWALLREHLETGRRLQACQRCQRLFTGKAHKRFCHQNDNAACYLQRRADDRRRSRLRSGR